MNELPSGGHFCSPHAALTDHHLLGPDIYGPLFDKLWRSYRFTNWLKPENRWQLRCEGSPGSGKTTFSALAARYLRQQFPGVRNRIASIFVVQDVGPNDDNFVSCFLQSVLYQLTERVKPNSIQDQTATGSDCGAYQEYLREEICTLIPSAEKVFLIVDDLDRCHVEVQAALEQEIRHFQDRGMKVMVTSRVARVDEILIDTYCDCADCCMEDTQVHVFWKCDTCGFIVCYACRDGGKFCANCGDLPCLRQPYEHVSIDIGRLGNLLEGFVVWDLENEHGDLGIATNNSDTGKPPPSLLGHGLNQPDNNGGIEDLVDKIVSQAEGNVCLARMRLDNLHMLASVEEVEVDFADRLPANIVAFFDDAVRSIMTQDEERRALGILAIAAMAKFPYAEGVAFARFQDAVREFNRTQTGIAVECPNVDTALAAGNGFLVTEVLQGRPIMAYSEAFYRYATEGYNELLAWSVANIRLDNVEWFRRIQKTKTSLNGFDLGRLSAPKKGFQNSTKRRHKHEAVVSERALDCRGRPGVPRPARRQTAIV